MKNLQIRDTVRGYKRDSYLGQASALNPHIDPIDCEVGYSQWGMAPKAAAAAREFDPETVTAYPELFHDTLLKPAILSCFELDDECKRLLFFGHGSFNLAERLIHKMIAPTRMLGVGPQFNEIPTEFVAAGGTYHTVEIEGPKFAFPFERLMNEVKTGKYSVLYLDNPNNPLGRLVQVSHIRDLAKEAQKHGTIVMIDEAYGDFVAEVFSAVSLVTECSNMIVIRSFSKGLGLAAERVGYMFVSAEIAEVYGQLDVPFEPTLYAATLAAATMCDDRYILMMRNRVLTDKDRITTVLMDNGYLVLPTHPMVSIMTVMHPSENGNIVTLMHRMGIKIEPGAAFVQTHSGWTNRMCRIRIPKPELVNEFCRRIQEMKEW